MNRDRMRRITWITHNTLVSPIIIIRLPLFVLAVLGEWAGKALLMMPGLRAYDGWSGPNEQG